jgi:hypothetical protein
MSLLDVPKTAVQLTKVRDEEEKKGQEGTARGAGMFSSSSDKVP